MKSGVLRQNPSSLLDYRAVAFHSHHHWALIAILVQGQSSWYNRPCHVQKSLFAAKLKVQGEPLPSKETIQEFAAEQNIGTIFFVIGMFCFSISL